MPAPAAARLERPVLRTAVDADRGFLDELFADARPELAVLPAELLALQVRAQRTHLRAAHPDALDRVVEVDGRPVGRCWTAPTSSGTHLLDLAVHSGWRRRGIARAVVGHLLEADGVLTLHVRADNHPARALYAGLGLVETGRAGLDLAMAAPITTPGERR